jgi:DUF1680 family protein
MSASTEKILIMASEPTKIISMKKLFKLFLLVTSVNAFAQKTDYPIRPVEFTSVKLSDNFWLPRIEMNRTITIPASFERCENTGRVKNFVYAATKEGKFCTRFPFDDTDIYKTIEGASFSLATHPDKKLEAYIDSLITIIGKAQEPDGYLYTARTINPAEPHPWSGKERWEKEREGSHELYNAGHLYEAAAAHYRATGKTNLLNIALKNADLVCSVFGPDRKHVAPGHEVVEMGLVKLYRITGKEKYLATAKFFIGERGHYNGYDPKSSDVWKNGSYWQDDKPVVEQDEAEGHAVRAGYLYAAVADVAALTGDDSLLRAIDTIWQNMVSRKIYVQGGVGAIPNGERFGKNYELPNATAYNETCAAIASVFWNQRMFQLHGDSKYIDVLERTLYNGLLSGIGLDGQSFFYTNAMEVRNSFTHGSLERSRSGWFECSCCPTNLVRFIPSLPGYVYAQKADDVYVNLFMSNSASVKLKNTTLKITQQNNYPWDGHLNFLIDPEHQQNFGVLIRIPGWSQNTAIPSDLYHFADSAAQKPSISVNGKQQQYSIENGYAVLRRPWKKGDRIEVDLPMPVRRIVAHENLPDDIGKVALQRGPIVYCAEWNDNGGKTDNIMIPRAVSFSEEFKKDLLNGVTILKATTPSVTISANGEKISTEPHSFIAIPYYAWANRGEGEMTIWFPTAVKDIDLITK